MGRMRLLALVALIALGSLHRPLAARASRADFGGEITLSFAPIVKKVAPAVVNVYASRTDVQPRNPLFDDPIFRHFFGDGIRRRAVPAARPRSRSAPAS